jgi:hypothetical protein
MKKMISWNSKGSRPLRARRGSIIAIAVASLAAGGWNCCDAQEDCNAYGVNGHYYSSYSVETTLCDSSCNILASDKCQVRGYSPDGVQEVNCYNGNGSPPTYNRCEFYSVDVTVTGQDGTPYCSSGSPCGHGCSNWRDVPPGSTVTVETDKVLSCYE